MKMKLAALIMLLVVFAIPAVADDVDRWIQGLNDTSPGVREAAAEALGELGDTRAVEPLIRALKDEDSSVRLYAADALGELNDTRAVEPLIQALKDENSSVRLVAAWFFFRLNDNRAVEPLIILALKDKDSNIRDNAAGALSMLKDTRAVEPLILALKDENSSARAIAANALVQLNDTRAVEPLIQALKDEDWMVRAIAAYALAQLNDTRAVEPLIQALKDEDRSVRSGAVYALGELGDTRAIEPLTSALNDEDVEVQDATREALTKLGWRAPFGQTTTIFDNWNKGYVDNNPTGNTSFIISEPQMITYIDTYHWNYGLGTRSGGTITLRKDDGTKYGPWQVKTKPGQGGVPNAWWIAYPNEVIPAGTYTIFDSEPETWSKNSESNDCGFSKVEGHTSPSQAPARPVSTIPFDPETGSYKVGSDMVKLPSRDSLIQTSDWGEVPANQVIVMLKEGKGRIDADRLASSLAGQVVGFFEYINLYQIETSGKTEEELESAMAKAGQDPDVELAFPNQQDYLDATVQGMQCSPLDDPVYSEGGRGKGYEMIGVQRAWDLIRASGLPLSDVHVGVIDNGLYKGNDEFNGKAKIDTNEPDSELNVPENQYGSHGTEVINLIAADPDNGGIAGIASGALKDKLEVSVANKYAPPYGNIPRSAPDPNDPTKVVWTNGKTYTLGVLSAINKTINDGAKIISCSWGNSNSDLDSAAAFKKFFEKMAKDHPDVIFVCSAGNDGKALDGPHRYPSGLALPNMITVGNIMNDGTNTANSNMASGNFEVTIAAPGEESVHGFDNKGGIENSLGGTSMATPQVTSAAALIRALNPQLTAGEIKDILVASARTSVGVDGKKVPAPPELGGSILAIDLAVFKVINDQRKKQGLEPFQDIDSALGSARIGLVAKNDPANPKEWSVTADIQGVSKDGTDVTFVLQGEGAVGGDSKKHLSQSGSLTWSVTLKGDTGTVVATRSDTKGCSRAYLVAPAIQNEVQTVQEYDSDGKLLWEVEGYRHESDQKYEVLNRSSPSKDSFIANILRRKGSEIPICIIHDGYQLVPHGKFKSWTLGGGDVWETPIVEGEYRNGLKQGRWDFWYTGEFRGVPAKKAAEGEYLDGLQVGHWKYYDYYCKDMVAREGDYLNGVEQEGTWIETEYVMDQGKCVPGKSSPSAIEARRSYQE